MTVTEEGCPFTWLYYNSEIGYKKGMLPQTDELLNRAKNISIGVSDVGLGSVYRIHITSTKEEIQEKGKFLLKTIEESL